MDLDQLSRIALALGIGLLIGLERGWRAREADDGSRAAGIRTFAISGLMGGVVGAIVDGLGGAESPGGGIAFGLAFAACGAVIATFSRDENRVAKTVSATTTIAGMLTFALGAYALLGDVRIAAAAAWNTPGIWASVRHENAMRSSVLPRAIAPTPWASSSFWRTASASTPFTRRHMK